MAVIRRTSAVFVVAGVILAGAALHQVYQAVGSHWETSARLVRDYGAFAAWSYRQHASEELRQIFRGAFTPVVHREPGGPALGAITPGAWRAKLGLSGGGDACTEACNPSQSAVEQKCPTACIPDYHFRYPLDGSGRAEFAGNAPSIEQQQAITSSVGSHAAGPGRPTGDFTTIRTSDEGAGPMLVYAIVEADQGPPVAYGFQFDPAQHHTLFDELFRGRQLLPDVVTERRANSDLLGVRVRDPGGRVHFSSSDDSVWAERTSETFDEQLGGLVVEAAILEPTAGALMGGAASRARLPLIAGLLALACGLAVVALRQMRREAQLARMRSDFVSSVSHELRTPLAQIQLFLETLRLGRHRTDEQREWLLDNMQRETTRLTNLVDNVLHFARSERTGMGGARSTTMIAEYLGGIVAEFEPLALARRVKLRTRFASELAAELHQESFRQVILNLLDNAVKYGPLGQQITVSSEASGEHVRIVVEDEGPGVEPGEGTLIFEPFRRGERAIGSVAVGSGIGLSVARELVEWHGGRIWVEPAPAGGARFVIDIPAATKGELSPARDRGTVQPSLA